MNIRNVLNFIFILTLFLLPLYAQPVRSPELNELLIKFKANRGDVFFPDIYQHYKNLLASPTLKPASGSNGQPEFDAEKVKKELKDWIQKALQAQDFLTPVLEIRDKVLEIHAEDFAEESFRQAEEKLQEVALKVAKGDRRDAEKHIIPLVRIYRKTYGETVRNNLLGEVRILLQESKNLNGEKLAPRTYQLTVQLLAEVEALIQAQRYESPDLDRKATLLREEANHLWKITRMIHNFNKKGGNAEAFILQLENQLLDVGKLLNLNPKFSRGILPILQDIRQAIANLKEEYQQLTNINQRLVRENQELQAQLLQYQENRQIAESLRQKVDTIRAEVKGIVEIQQLDTFLILKIPNFAFESGSMDIRPLEGKKLNKLILVLREFPNRRLIIKYIQPQRGDFAYNQTLALKRAESIKNYLQAFVYLDDSSVDIVGEVTKEALPYSSASGEVEVTLRLKPNSPW